MSTCTVTGHVSTSRGWPLEGATVTLLDPQGRQSARSSCDGEGAFTLVDVPSGTTTVLVAAPSHQPKVMSLSIPRTTQWEMGEVRLARSGASATPPAGRWEIDPVHSSIRARAQHFGLGGVQGGFQQFAGSILVADDPTRSRVDVTIEAASIDTGNAQRDEHLRSADFLDVANHPTIGFHCDRVTRAGESWLMDGHLTLVDATRPVTLTMDYLGTGQDSWGGTRAAFSATCQLRRQDFNITWNQAVAAGIDAIGTTLQVTIDVEAVRT